ncbi:DUF402 domain-containing protein [Actinoplanes sp. CA-131856]
MRFEAGRVITRNYVRGPWHTWAQAVRVVADDDGGLWLWQPVGADFATIVDADGKTGHDLSPGRMRDPRLVARRWQHVDVLMLMRPGAAHFARTGRGVQTTDSVLDIVVSAGRAWEWKDEDEFEGHVGERVVKLIEAGDFPFDGSHTGFRPGRDWDLPRFSGEIS